MKPIYEVTVRGMGLVLPSMKPIYEVEVCLREMGVVLPHMRLIIGNRCHKSRIAAAKLYRCRVNVCNCSLCSQLKRVPCSDSFTFANAKKREAAL